MEASGQVGNCNLEVETHASVAISSMPVDGIHSDQKEAYSTHTKALEISFAAILEDNQKIIYKISRLYCKQNREDENDLFQEISCQLWKAYPNFKGKSQVSTWVYRIALNTAFMMVRKKLTQVEALEEIPETPIHSDYEGQDAVLTYLRSLSLTDRAIVTLKMSGHTHQEIAEMIHLTEDGVRMRLSRLREKW